MKKHETGEICQTKSDMIRLGGNVCYDYYVIKSSYRVYVNEKNYYAFHLLSEIITEPSFDHHVECCWEYAYPEQFEKLDGDISKLPEHKYQKLRKIAIQEYCDFMLENTNLNIDKFLKDKKYRDNFYDTINLAVAELQTNIDKLHRPSAGIYQCH